MKQGAAGRDDEMARAALEPLQRVERMLEVVDPDVPAVADAGEEPLIAQSLLGGDELGVVPSPVHVDIRREQVTVHVAGEVQAYALDGQVAEDAVGVADVVEVRLDEDARALVHLAELLVREP